MSVKIIIDRKFKEDPLPENFKDINKLRIKAMQQGGYISGETLIGLEDNRSVIVLSNWSSAQVIPRKKYVPARMIALPQRRGWI